MPNPDNVLEGAVKCRADLVYTVPSFIEVCHHIPITRYPTHAACVTAMGTRSRESARYEADEGLGSSVQRHLSSFLLTAYLQLFGGAPLNKSVGDSLASQGIALFTGYGR